MALTSSGQISMSDIRTELGDSGAISLKEASDGTIVALNTTSVDAGDGPDGSTPHAMSEWYSYDHSASGASTAWSNNPGNFSISGGTWPGSTTSNKTITLANGSGTTTVSCPTSTTGGTLTVAIDTSSTPSSGHVATASVTQNGSGTLYMQFKLTAIRFKDGTSQNKTVTITNNGVSTTFVVDCSQAGF